MGVDVKTSNRSLHVLMIEPSGAGGIAHYTYGLAKGLGELGVKVEILTGHRWMDWSLPEDVQVHKIFQGIKSNPFQFLMHLWRLRKNVDLVHWQCVARPRVWRWLMRLLPLKHVPWVFTVHNLLPHERETISSTFFREVYQQMDGLIFHTQYTQELFTKWFSDIQTKTAVIPLGEYGFFPADEENFQEKENTLLFFGNIRAYKGLDLLLEAMPIIRQAIPEAQLQIVGQALEPFQRYEQQIQKHNLEPWIDVRLGYQPDKDIPRIFRSASVVVLPYREIDQSAVLLLALAMGCPVIATRVGGIAEVIRDQETGVLVEPDDPLSLAEAVIGLLHDREKRKRLGEAARRDVEERFSWNRIAQKTEDFYKTVYEDAHS